MANPDLQRDSPETDWVEYLQGCLEQALRADADSGSVQLSKVDGLFGPITEESVRYFQRKSGLPEDGVVGEATWQALEAAAAGSPGSSSSSGGGGAGSTVGPNIDVTIPFKLQTTWPTGTLEQINNGWSSFDLKIQPNTKLTFNKSVGRLFGNGGLQLLNLELQGWDGWFLDWSTKGVLEWSKTAGVQLGTDNHVELGYRPGRGITLSVEGNLKGLWSPSTGTGSISGYGGLTIKLNLDWLGGKP